MTGQDAVGALLDRVRDWWRRQGELSALGNKEIGRVAEDLRISTDTLRDLVARGPEAANLLYERMQALGISKADVDKAAGCHAGYAKDVRVLQREGRVREGPGGPPR